MTRKFRMREETPSSATESKVVQSGAEKRQEEQSRTKKRQEKQAPFKIEETPHQNKTTKLRMWTTTSVDH